MSNKDHRKSENRKSYGYSYLGWRDYYGGIQYPGISYPKIINFLLYTSSLKCAIVQIFTSWQVDVRSYHKIGFVLRTLSRKHFSRSFLHVHNTCQISPIPLYTHITISTDSISVLHNLHLYTKFNYLVSCNNIMMDYSTCLSNSYKYFPFGLTNQQG